MVALDVRADLLDELVVGLGLDDLAALAVDHLRHGCPFRSVAAIVHATAWRYVGETLASRDTRIQLCGRVVVRLGGRRVEGELPGRQGRLLFVYLAATRSHAVPRDELVDALWPRDAPEKADASLSALVSKLRRAVPVEGRSDLQLVLPADAWIDLEAASEALHRAESAAARRDWAAAWAPARVTQHIAARGFLQGEDAPWIEERRRSLETLYLRSLELAGRASLELGGTEIDTAERAARALVARAPFRETGYRLLMEILAARGNDAEALRVYEGLRALLREELGTAPSSETQALHRQLLAG
jgi:SARP family transcriptional regulator, regulator of embCAB operon